MSSEINLNNYQNKGDSFAEFPVVTISENKRILYFLLYRFINGEGKDDYIVIGLLDTRYKILKEEFENWIKIVKSLITLAKKNNFSEKYRLLFSQLNLSEFSKRIRFSQEGYDLISGKFNFTKNHTIQRTILMEENKVEYINEENKMLENGFLHSLEDYNYNYFLNNYDYNNMDLEALIKYERDNKDRLIKYFLKKEQWILRKVKKELEKEAADLTFMVSLLDSIIERQNQKKYSKRKIK